VAVNCSLLPAEIEGFAGVTAIETSVGGVTMSVVVPLIAFTVAVMVDTPCATVVARPLTLIVAALLALHVTALVKFSVVPLLKWPVAVNCCWVPSGMDGLAGVTVIAVKPLTLPVPVRLTTLGLP
jgi:hypothetical protein